MLKGAKYFHDRKKERTPFAVPLQNVMYLLTCANFKALWLCYIDFCMKKRRNRREKYVSLDNGFLLFSPEFSTCKAKAAVAFYTAPSRPRKHSPLITCSSTV